MPGLDKVAKSLLVDTSIKSCARYADGGIILADVCPACGEDHSSILLYELDRNIGLICPNTGVEVYAIYG